MNHVLLYMYRVPFMGGRKPRNPSNYIGESAVCQSVRDLNLVSGTPLMADIQAESNLTM